MNLSVKNVPEHIIEQLRERARRNHRSLQGELMVILEASTAPSPMVSEPVAQYEVAGTHERADMKTIDELRELLGLRRHSTPEAASQRGQARGRLSGKITIEELYEMGVRSGLRTGNESVQMIREDRDAR